MIRKEGSRIRCWRRAASHCIPRGVGNYDRIERETGHARPARIGAILAIAAASFWVAMLSAPARAQVPATPGGMPAAVPVMPGPGEPGHISYTKSPLAAGAQTPSVKLKASPIGKQEVPDVMVPPTETKNLEHTPWTNDVFLHQWSLTKLVPEESIFNDAYMRTRDTNTRSISLKEAIYLALKNNPAVAAASLEPVASLQGVRGSWAVFDPDFTGQVGEQKTVTPTTSVLQTGGATGFVQKSYVWNFALNKTLATTNGTLGLTFVNNYASTNSIFSSVNPSYNPGLTLSLIQPLLRNFGNEFATINVRIAESNQKESQYTYEQQLNDFVLQVGTDYWNVVRDEENLEVANKALAVAQDLVRQNAISVKVGVLAPLSLKEAQSEAATDLSNVYQAEGALDTARAVLRQDVMYNPDKTFLPVMLEPVERPNPRELDINDEQSLELAMMYRPELAAMRQAIRSMLLQVKYAENQTLPQFNISAQIGLSGTAGALACNQNLAGFGTTGSSGIPCTVPGTNPPLQGVELPFKGLYNDAFNRMWKFSFYNYAVVFNFERPLNNDAAKAALAQAKIAYEQQRLQYRQLISQVVVDVEQSLNNVKANYKSAQAARTATEFAAASLHDERERFRVGMATTHDLLQYIDSLVAAEGNQVNAEANFEISKLAVKHAEGTLLRAYNINFVAENPNVRPWYARF